MSKQSVYLSRADEERWKLLGVPLSGVLRVGLDALEARPDLKQTAGKSRRGLTRPTPGDCDHPAARRDAKNPHLCRACGGYLS